MNEKLKHISNYCCEPKSEAEFLAVKLAAEIGRVDWYENNNYILTNVIVFSKYNGNKLKGYVDVTDYDLIPVHEYCELLMKDEIEFDRRVDLESFNHYYFSEGYKAFICNEGYHWEVNGNEVSLLKDE